MRTRSGMIAIRQIAWRQFNVSFVSGALYKILGLLEGRHSTKEPRYLQCLRTLLSRVGLKEVNFIKQGVEQP